MVPQPEQLVRRTMIACWVMLALHILGVAVGLFGLATELSGHRPPPTFGSGSFGAGQQLGYALTVPLLLVVNGVAGLWAGANARGLRDRKPWAYRSTLAYSAFVALSCCCIPAGLYGLWSLTRPGVADFLRGGDSR